MAADTSVANDPWAHARAPGDLRVATFNMLKGGGTRVRPAQVLRDTRADLLLLQEAAGFGRLRSPAVWTRVENRPWGSAIVAARGRLEPLPVPAFEGWVVAARWHRPEGHPVDVVSVHAPYRSGGYVGAMFGIVDALAAALGAQPGHPLIVGGDFNVCVSARSHDGSTPGPRTRRLHEQLREQLGLVSCWDAANPARIPAQTLRWTGNPVTAYHCDGLFVPSQWCPALRRCVVRQDDRWRVRSDHNPVIATFGHPAPPAFRGYSPTRLVASR